MSEKMWICPDCGQWGRDGFGAHRLPERDVWDTERCDSAPVRVEAGPLLRSARPDELRGVVRGFLFPEASPDA